MDVQSKQGSPVRGRSAHRAFGISSSGKHVGYSYKSIGYNCKIFVGNCYNLDYSKLLQHNTMWKSYYKVDYHGKNADYFYEIVDFNCKNYSCEGRLLL